MSLLSRNIATPFKIHDENSSTIPTTGKGLKKHAHFNSDIPNKSINIKEDVIKGVGLAPKSNRKALSTLTNSHINIRATGTPGAGTIRKDIEGSNIKKVLKFDIKADIEMESGVDESSISELDKCSSPQYFKRPLSPDRRTTKEWQLEQQQLYNLVQNERNQRLLQEEIELTEEIPEFILSNEIIDFGCLDDLINENIEETELSHL